MRREIEMVAFACIVGLVWLILLYGWFQLRDALGRVGWISDKANDRDACPGCLAQGRMVAARG